MNNDKPWDSGSGFEIESETTAILNDKSRNEAEDGSADIEDISDDESEGDMSDASESDVRERKKRTSKTKEVEVIKRIQKTLSRLYTMKEFAWSFDELEYDGVTVQGTSFEMEKLCGTFLISIFADCKPKDVSQILQNGVSKTWLHKRDEWCAFLS